MRLKIVPILIISSILTVGILGFFSLASVDHSEQHSCPVSLIPGSACPIIKEGTALALYHMSGLQNLTQFVINLAASLSILSILIIFASLAFSKFLQKVPLLQLPSFQRHDRTTRFLFLFKKRLLRWFALRHKRKSHAFWLVYDA